MFSAFLVLFVLLFVFATIGVFLFDAVITGDEISDRAGFQTFGNALFLVYRYLSSLSSSTHTHIYIYILTNLFCSRMSTGEAWEVIMHDVMRATSDWAVIYFVSFVPKRFLAYY